MVSKEVISIKEVQPLTGAPYSPAIKTDRLIFVSGILPTDFKAKVQDQTRQILEKIKALLDAGGSSLDNVVKCTVLITDTNEFNLMNDAYREYFPEKPPARTTIHVSWLAGAKVEIDAIATIP